MYVAGGLVLVVVAFGLWARMDGRRQERKRQEAERAKDAAEQGERTANARRDIEKKIKDIWNNYRGALLPCALSLGLLAGCSQRTPGNCNYPSIDYRVAPLTEQTDPSMRAWAHAMTASVDAYNQWAEQQNAQQ